MDEHTESTVTQPVFTVVRARADDIELAALTAALTAVRDAMTGTRSVPTPVAGEAVHTE
jgi:hypothetical protein